MRPLPHRSLLGSLSAVALTLLLPLQFGFLGALPPLPIGASVTLPIVLNFKPGAVNQITIQLPGSPLVFTSQLSGHVNADTVLNVTQLLSSQGFVAMVHITDILIAGTSFPILGGLESGTVCVLQNPAGTSGGIAYLRPLLAQRADFHLTLDTLVSVLNPQLAALGRLPFVAPVDASVPFNTVSALKLLAGQQAFEIPQRIESTIDPSVPLLGGAHVVVEATFVNGSTPQNDALTAECAAAY